MTVSQKHKSGDYKRRELLLLKRHFFVVFFLSVPGPRVGVLVNLLIIQNMKMLLNFLKSLKLHTISICLGHV
jgi:hypothetical protein